MEKEWNEEIEAWQLASRDQVEKVENVLCNYHKRRIFDNHEAYRVSQCANFRNDELSA